MNVLYLLNRVRDDLVEKIRIGKSHDNHFYGMLRLPQYGVEASYIELEQFYPKPAAAFLRKHFLNIYWAHAPLFFKFLSYDIVFSSASFGSQLIHTLYPFKKPKWVMFDFSITGLIGSGSTLRQKIFRWMTKKSAGIVTISSWEKDLLLSKYPELKGRVEFIRFGVDTEFFKPQRGINEEKEILTVGFDYGRDYPAFFAATEGLDVKVVAAARLAKLQKFAPIPTYLEAREFSPEDMVKEFAKAQIVIIPLNTSGGTNDAMGTSTLVEAMAMGKAIIITDTPTIRSYVEHDKTAILVPEGDPQALHEAIISLMDDPKKRQKLGKAAREFAVAHCTSDMFAKELAEFFRNIATQ